jgi:hypothetical protein
MKSENRYSSGKGIIPTRKTKNRKKNVSIIFKT